MLFFLKETKAKKCEPESAKRFVGLGLGAEEPSQVRIWVRSLKKLAHPPRPDSGFGCTALITAVNFVPK